MGVRGRFRTVGPSERDALIRAVLFDLDDTLFDHRHASRQALEAVRECHPTVASVDASDLDRRHAEILETLHLRVLAKEMMLDDARLERFRRLFECVGVSSAELEDGSLARRAAVAYRTRYMQSWREVRGATALLLALRPQVRIGIVSNNLAREQHDKLRFCGFDRHLDAILISEEAGVAKPDPAIFRQALERLSAGAEETVMIGDAWATDIAGARAAGVRAIWFNPAATPRPEAWHDVEEIQALEPVSAVLSVVFGGHNRRG
jgi:putative hydrolase of the HAD superfamily